MFLLVSNKNWKNINGAEYWIDCKLNSKTDEIENEPGDKADRVVKISMEIEMDAKLPYIDRAVVGTPVNNINLDYYLSDNIQKKIEKIKDNVTDDDYLAYLTEYVGSDVIV